jgi:hypothetical protein
VQLIEEDPWYWARRHGSSRDDSVDGAEAKWGVAVISVQVQVFICWGETNWTGMVGWLVVDWSRRCNRFWRSAQRRVPGPRVMVDGSYSSEYSMVKESVPAASLSMSCSVHSH